MVLLTKTDLNKFLGRKDNVEYYIFLIDKCISGDSLQTRANIDPRRTLKKIDILQRQLLN